MGTANINEKSAGCIYAVGLGMRLVAQITLESNYLLQQMDLIFHCEDDHDTSDYIASLPGTEINLRCLYVEGKNRQLAYQEMCDRIIEAASGGAKCAYLTPGNPAFLNTVVSKLRESAMRHGILFVVYPGISSIDAVLADLSFAGEATGLQCFEATHFVRLRPSIDKRVPLILFQPAVVEAPDVRYKAGVHLEGVRVLRDVLIELYGAQQQWILWRGAMSRDDGVILSTGVLAELVEKGNHLELGTLIIPANKSRENPHLIS